MPSRCCRTAWAKVLNRSFSVFKVASRGSRCEEKRDGTTTEHEIALRYVTQDLVDKEYSRITAEGGQSGSVPGRLLSTVWHCVVTECMWDAVKRFKSPTVDFKLLRRECELRTKAKFCAIASTSGTATEVTAFSVITDYEKGIKYPLADFNITPDVAIVDPELTYTMPQKLCAHTGMDALTHAIEAYVSTAGSMFTDANALHAIREIVEWLPKSYTGDKEARQHMHEAQCIAGIAFSSGLLGIVHSMAHKTGAAFTGDHIIHGCANAMYLGKVIQFNAKDARAKSRYAYIAKEVLHLAGETEDELVAALVQEIRDLNDKLNIPQGIKNYGKGGVKAEESIIDYAEFEAKKSDVAANAILDACTGSNPRQPTQEEMEKLLECVYNDQDVDF